MIGQSILRIGGVMMMMIVWWGREGGVSRYHGGDIMGHDLIVGYKEWGRRDVYGRTEEEGEMNIC